MWPCGLYYAAPHVLKSSLALCPGGSSFLFSIVITSLGEEGICFVRVRFCHFSPPHGVGGLAAFVIVALPGLFY